MTYASAFDARSGRNDVVSIRAIWPAAVLSLLVHLLALILAWPHIRAHLADADAVNAEASALAVQIAPPAAPRTSQSAPSVAAASPPPAPATAPTRNRAPRPPRSRAAPPPRASPPVLAAPSPTPAPSLPQPAPATPVAPSTPARTPDLAAPARPEPEPASPETPDESPPTDLAAYVESRRRARGEAPGATDPAAAARAEIARRDAIVAENLGLNKTPTFGYDPKSAGGLFQIREVNYDDAAFYFMGMDRDIGRRAKQLVEVRKGDAPDIRVAVVRRMIAIIRDNVKGDFWWSSQRLGKEVRLSARPEDNAGLEDFIMRDIFPQGPGAR